jgi:NADPH:quinone reductase-like Zn-dependent oxidoreductase
MKALVLQSAFGLDNLAFEDRAEPTPAQGQVQVRVRAVSLNYRDLLLARGHYNPKLKFPRVLGSDAAGEVVAVGPGVTRFVPGDKVVGCFMVNWDDGPYTDAAKSPFGSDRDGMLAESIVLEERGVLPLPQDLSFEEAATLPCAAVTAWNALTTAGCAPGTTVLLQGTGGVSIFALQLAKALGARTLITSSHDDKLSRALAMGADAGVNYKSNPDWEKWARDQTAGSGVDIVVEVGGAGTLERSLKAVRAGGHIALIGILAGAGSFNPMLVIMKSLRLQGVFVGSRAMFEAMNRVIVETRIKPAIDRVFPFADAVSALRHMESGSHFGKVVVKL